MHYLIARIVIEGKVVASTAIKTMPDESETVARSKSTQPGAGSSRPTLTLRNQEGNLGASFQSNGPLVTPQLSTHKIPTYFIWSIFNLLFVPFGIVCCYFSHKVSQLKIQNRYEAAKKIAHRTLVLNIMTTLLMCGVIVTIVMLRYDYDQRNMDTSVNATRTTAAYIPWQPGR
jgi:hypothetical protein